MKYSYECTKCEHIFEIEQGIKEDALVKCPECKKKGLQRIVTGGSGVLWKGHGKYKEHYYGKRTHSDQDFN